MKRTTDAALSEAELHLRTFLWLAIRDAKRVLAVLDGKMPVMDVKSADRPIPEPTMPKGNRVKFKRRSFNEEEVDFLDDGGLKELVRDAMAARVAYHKTMTLRRYGK
jgi:hypothetical protein